MLKLVMRACAYMLMFCTLLTIITLVFLPKWDYEKTQSGQVAGFYREPDNTLDVLYLGSCNMYSSVCKFTLPPTGKKATMNIRKGGRVVILAVLNQPTCSGVYPQHQR